MEGSKQQAEEAAVPFARHESARRNQKGHCLNERKTKTKTQFRDIHLRGCVR